MPTNKKAIQKELKKKAIQKELKKARQAHSDAEHRKRLAEAEAETKKATATISLLLQAAMTVADIYHEFPELMTPEEKEEDDSEEHDENGNCLVEVTSIPRWFNEHTTYLARPEAPSRAEFERRKPALGLSRKQIQQLRDHYNDPRLLPVQKRMFLDYLREKMLRQCISTDGCTTVEELLTILEAELDSNTPAPVPDWYEYTKITHGPRDTGFYLCENRGCFRTESCDKKPFDKCGNCKLARYCSRECQVADWKARHKKICKKAKEQRDMVEKYCRSHHR